MVKKKTLAAESSDDTTASNNLSATIIFQDQFAEYEVLEEELKTLQNNLMNEFSDVAKNKGKYRESLKFLADMGRNIVSVHDSRRQLIKEKVNIKKVTAELYLKQKKDGEGEGDNTNQTEVLDKLFDMLQADKHSKTSNLSKLKKDKEVLVSDSEQLELQYDELLQNRNQYIADINSDRDDEIINDIEMILEDEEEINQDINEIIDDIEDDEDEDTLKDKIQATNFIYDFLSDLGEKNILLVLDENYVCYFVNDDYEEIEDEDLLSTIKDKYFFDDLIYPLITFNIETEKFELTDSDGDTYELELIEFE